MTRSRVTGDVGYRAYKKNYLINGDMSVNQRDSSATLSTGDYGIDRWYVLNNSQLMTSSNGTVDGRDIINLRSERTISATLIKVAQLIELDSLVPTATFPLGNVYTLSFYMNVDVGDGATPTVGVEAHFMTDQADPAPAGCLVDNVEIGDVVGQYALVTARVTITGDATGKLGLRILIGVSYATTQVAGTRMRVSLAQLEEGSSATPFEYVSPQQNLAECQRYYERWGRSASSSVNRQISGYGGANINCADPILWKVEKRIDPTVTLNGTWSLTNASSLNASNGAKDGFLLTYTTVALDDFTVRTDSNDDYVEGDAEL